MYDRKLTFPFSFCIISFLPSSFSFPPQEVICKASSEQPRGVILFVSDIYLLMVPHGWHERWCYLAGFISYLTGNWWRDLACFSFFFSLELLCWFSPARRRILRATWLILLFGQGLLELLGWFCCYLALSFCYLASITGDTWLILHPQFNQGLMLLLLLLERRRVVLLNRWANSHSWPEEEMLLAWYLLLLGGLLIQLYWL